MSSSTPSTPQTPAASRTHREKTLRQLLAEAAVSIIQAGRAQRRLGRVLRQLAKEEPENGLLTYHQVAQRLSCSYDMAIKLGRKREIAEVELSPDCKRVTPESVEEFIRRRQRRKPKLVE